MVSGWMLLGCVVCSCFGCLCLLVAAWCLGVVLYGWFVCFCAVWAFLDVMVALLCYCGLVHGGRFVGLLAWLCNWSWQCLVSVYYLCLGFSWCLSFFSVLLDLGLCLIW